MRPGAEHRKLERAGRNGAPALGLEGIAFGIEIRHAVDQECIEHDARALRHGIASDRGVGLGDADLQRHWRQDAHRFLDGGIEAGKGAGVRERRRRVALAAAQLIEHIPRRARMQREKQQRPGQRALARFGCGCEQGRHLARDGFIARQRAVGIGTVDDDRAEVAVVTLSALACDPIQETALESFGRLHDPAIGRDRQVDRNESTAAPFAFHQLADQIRDPVAFGVAAEEKLDRQSSHQPARELPELQRFAGRPGSRLRLCKRGHASDQRVDAGLAQRRTDKAAIIGVPAAGHAGEARTHPPGGRVPWAAGQQADSAPGGRIGQQLAVERRAGGEHQRDSQHGDATRSHERQCVGQHHIAAMGLEAMARGHERVAREPKAPTQGRGTGQPDRRSLLHAVSPAGRWCLAARGGR